jgi:Kef-type K+ transport system membrane component KefB
MIWYSLLKCCRVLGGVLSFMKQPQVIGEMIAGIIMGPSVLGHIPGKGLIQLLCKPSATSHEVAHGGRMQ